jgi:hypothetical protein
MGKYLKAKVQRYFHNLLFCTFEILRITFKFYVCSGIYFMSNLDNMFLIYNFFLNKV